MFSGRQPLTLYYGDPALTLRHYAASSRRQTQCRCTLVLSKLNPATATPGCAATDRASSSSALDRSSGGILYPSIVAIRFFENGTSLAFRSGFKPALSNRPSISLIQFGDFRIHAASNRPPVDQTVVVHHVDPDVRLVRMPMTEAALQRDVLALTNSKTSRTASSYMDRYCRLRRRRRLFAGVSFGPSRKP